MHCLGYGSHIRQAWRDAYRAYDRLETARLPGTPLITTGSKAEGLTRLYESDWDRLYVVRGIICL
ncbi:hypothetical protein DPMN_088986 [Dreissena polymorpha]|uniref:Uncharacterized protein n=1 Tax=Dreissena polymorpha TaxID=45954 RepID=A0A9D4KVX9_DREPO|nr:hypothetical protein DPMN_088986 [Dreissena polymorpha]